MSKGLGSAVVALSLLLTGCDTFSLLRDQKIADAFHVGADKRSVSRDFGAPIATRPTLNGGRVPRLQPPLAERHRDAVLRRLQKQRRQSGGLWPHHLRGSAGQRQPEQ